MFDSVPPLSLAAPPHPLSLGLAHHHYSSVDWDSMYPEKVSWLAFDNKVLLYFMLATSASLLISHPETFWDLFDSVEFFFFFIAPG